MPDRSRRLDDWLLALALVATALLAWKFVGYAYDDAYITYRYAENLAAGHGFTYNRGDPPHLGTTTPFYTLLLAALGLWVDIPTASGVLSWLSLLGCVALVEALGRGAGIRFAGPLAALFLAGNPELYRMFGGETVFAYLLLLPAGWLLQRRGHAVPAAIAYGLAVLTRMDAALFVAVVYAAQAVRDRRLPWAPLAALAALGLPWIVWAGLTFGSPLPATLAVKMAHMESGRGGWDPLLPGALRYLAQLPEYGPWTRWLFLPLLALGLLRSLRSERVWLPFVATTLLFVVAYQLVLRPTFSHWYLANVYLSNALLLAAGLREAGAWIAARWPRAPAIGATALLALGLALAAARSAEGWRAFDVDDPRRQIYRKAGNWLRLHTAGDASVHYLEIGYLGYHSRRTVIDPIGLVTPGGLEAIRRGDRLWALRAYRPDYYLVNSAIADPALTDPDFRRHYRAVHRIDQEGHPASLTVFRRRPEAP